jgi:hypothetical protein
MHANPEWMSTHQGATLEEDLDILLKDLCVGWGWCNYTVFGETLLRGGGSVTDEAFALAVLDEGVDPEARGDRVRAIARFFQHRYGRAAVSEGDYVPGEPPSYTVPPTSPHPAANDPPSPALIEARKGMAQPNETTAALDPEARETRLRDLRAAIRSARRVRGIALGPEIAAADADLCALFLLHERLTGEFWTSDPDARNRLGFDSALGRSAGSTPAQEPL